MKGKAEQPLRAGAGDDLGVARLVVRHLALAVGGEQAFGGFADHDEIERMGAPVGQRSGHAGNGAHRPHAGIERQLEAQFDLRRDLRAVGIADCRVAHGGKQNGVGPTGGLQGRLRQRFATFGITGGAGGTDVVFQGNAADLAAGAIEDRQTGLHDFGADAVAGQNTDLEGVDVSGHAVGSRAATGIFERRPSSALARPGQGPLWPVRATGPGTMQKAARRMA